MIAEAIGRHDPRQVSTGRTPLVLLPTLLPTYLQSLLYTDSVSCAKMRPVEGGAITRLGRTRRRGGGLRIVTVANGKGGVGKTTTTVNLAGILGKKMRVLVVDSDPQESATWWMERSEGAEPKVEVVQETDPKMLGRVREVGGYDVVLVDTRPALRAQALGAVIGASDYVVLPSPPAPMDVVALIETVRQEVRPSGVRHRVLLTRVDSRSRGEAEEARGALVAAGIPVFDNLVREYKAHRTASLLGIPISRLGLSRGRNAADDYRRVAAEILADLEEKPDGRG
jgi:chromosome partitioning protein